MTRRLANRIGVAFVVAAVLFGLSGSADSVAEQLTGGVWGTQVAADYWGNMSAPDHAVLGFFGMTICSGYGLAASFAFGPWGAFVASASCGVSMWA